MVKQSYVEEPQGECAEDSVVTARDRSAFVIFTSAGIYEGSQLEWFD